MTAGTLTQLPRTTVVTVSRRERDQREKALARLAEAWLHGTPGHPDDAADLLACNASTRLTATRRADLWQAYLAETDRDAAFWAGAAEFRDLAPWDAGRRARLALDDLLDGTDFYATEGEL